MSGTFRGPRIALVLAGLALAGTGLVGTTGSATATGPVTDGSDWGSQGTQSSDSAVTVRWDNHGNSAEDTVPRNGFQVIPHTDGKTYDDVAGKVSDAYASKFGDDNGFGGLAVRVSQTSELVNQAVTVDVTGAAGGLDPATQDYSTYFQVFQCWGGLTAAGRPDPAAANPDPATCQVGENGPDSSNANNLINSEERYVIGDPLITSGGDWRQYSLANSGAVPFTAISGDVANGNKGQNKYFNKDDTNELSRVVPDHNGNATRQFEIQTSVESAGLGCGRRADAPSTSACWLVVVPRVDGVMTADDGPISPSLWAQRLQVRIGMRDVPAGCPSGQARELIGGSEMLANAAASWTPGVCDARHIALGYTQLGDEVARNQYAAGSNPAILTTQAVDKQHPAVVVPVGLTAPVIAYQLIYQPRCRWTADSTEQDAKDCGYASLAALKQDTDRAGTLIRDLKLDARLVVKLLTQSYQFAIINREGFSRTVPWMTDRPITIGSDPEFLRLNPDLRNMNLLNASEQAVDHLLVESLRSDAASELWQWILTDPDASAFLNGCPDDNGMTINPFYSTRTYVGCSQQSVALIAREKSDVGATTTAKAYHDSALSYPPLGSPYPLPTWQEAVAPNLPTYGVVDQLPPVDSMVSAGRDVGIGYSPQNSLLCANTPQVPNDDCGPQPGKWKDPKVRQRASQLGLMAITDASTAARWRVPTAQLCNTAGTQCVGATTSSLEKAAQRFQTGTDGFATPGDTDYASGAYPLTLPVYAAIDPNLPLSDRKAYADALGYVTTTGQRPGFATGDLPPGYAPMSSAMVKQANAALSALRSPHPLSTPSSTDTSSAPTTDSSATPTTSGDGASVPPTASAAPTSGTGVAPDATAQGIVPVSAGSETWPSWTVPLGLGIALLAGIAGPVLRFRGVVRIGR